MNETQLCDRIRKRHPAPAWAVLQHVRNQTGYRKVQVRTADAIALSLYPSNGLVMHGFEIKVSASDLRKELLDPTKAAEFSEYCDYWWLVISSESIMQGVQIPDAWGVLVANGQSLKVLTPAPKRTPKPMDIGLVCGLIRKAAEATDNIIKGMVPIADLNTLAEKRATEKLEQHTRVMKYELDALKRSVDEFEKESGLKIVNGWRCSQTAKAVKHVMEHGTETIIEFAREDARRSKRYLERLEGFLSEVDAELEVAEK